MTAVTLFDSLDTAARARIAAGSCEVKSPSGTLIFRRGEACRGLYIVGSGQVKLMLQAARGGEKVVELVGAGGTFGETAMFLDHPHVLTAEALADSRLICVARSTVMAELERTPGFARSVITNLSRRFRFLAEELEDCTLHSGTERVIGYLLNRLPTGAVNGQAMVTLPTKKGVIASQLNLTQEHFSRILHELFTEGLIEVERRNVRIACVSRLRARAGLSLTLRDRAARNCVSALPS